MQVGGGKPKMRYYFGENGWPKSKLGGAPQTDGEKELLIDSLQVRRDRNLQPALKFKVGRRTGFRHWYVDALHLWKHTCAALPFRERRVQLSTWIFVWHRPSLPYTVIFMLAPIPLGCGQDSTAALSTWFATLLLLALAWRTFCAPHQYGVMAISIERRAPFSGVVYCGGAVIRTARPAFTRNT